MVLGETYKPVSPRAGTKGLVPALQPSPPEDVVAVPVPQLRKQDTFLIRYSLSFLAATCAETITYPLDLIKGMALVVVVCRMFLTSFGTL